MDKVQQRFLAIAVAALMTGVGEAKKFFPDDPLRREPEPLPVEQAKRRKLSEYYDYLNNTFKHPGERHAPGHPIPAKDTNTLDEVPDSTWYTNRHYYKKMPLEELIQGPGSSHAPETSQPWQVVAGKTEGITPGLTIQDSRGRRYLLKADPLSNPELASSADVIGTKFFYAFGYNTPENYIVNFQRSQLVVGEKSEFTDQRGVVRSMKNDDIERVLEQMPRNKEGIYRGMASLYLAGSPLGPFRYHGTRSDDPNDIVPHEHRRELRGLKVFAAWLNHNDSKAGNTLDTLVRDGGKQYIRHHLIDFGATLGSDSFTAKTPRAGNEYLFAWAPAAQQFFTLGFYVPKWMRADYPRRVKSVGRFEADVFDPDDWKGNYETPAFVNCLPDDGFWAAKQVMAFTDEEIFALVRTGEYSDPRATDYVARTLMARRNKIGQTYFNMVLPLDRFAVEGGRLTFEDLGAKYKIASPQDYRVEWAAFDNEQETETALNQTGLEIPRAAAAYLAATVRGTDPKKTVKVYLRNHNGKSEVVGIHRTW